MGRPALNLAGMKVGYITVRKKAGKVEQTRENLWECECECGKLFLVETSRLSKGRIKSCGCHKGDNFRIHNMRHTRIYNIWCGMKQRSQRKTGSYKNIECCEEWKEFLPFYEWAINNGYNDSLTLDRIENNGNYEPSNCRWVSQKVQQNNRSNNARYTVNDETHTLSEWSEITGICSSTLSARILKLGWSVEKALTTPLKKERYT